MKCQICDRTNATPCEDCKGAYCNSHTCVIHTNCAECRKAMTAREGLPCGVCGAVPVRSSAGVDFKPCSVCLSRPA